MIAIVRWMSILHIHICGTDMDIVTLLQGRLHHNHMIDAVATLINCVLRLRIHQSDVYGKLLM